MGIRCTYQQQQFAQKHERVACVIRRVVSLHCLISISHLILQSHFYPSVSLLLSNTYSIHITILVDWKGLELYDYPKIITKMMDLGTIRKNLKKSKYIDAYQCAQDIRQVWNNCMTYNEDGSDFYRLGQSYSKRFEERYQKLVDEFGENIVIPRQTTAAATTATTNTANDADDDDIDDNAANEVDKISPEKNSNNKAGCGVGRSKSRSNSISTTGKNTPPPPTIKGGTSASKIVKLNNNTSNNGDDYSANGGSGSGNIVPLDVRTRFAARLQRLSGMELGHVLQVIDINCPEAIEDPTYDQLLTTTDAPPPASMLSHRYMWDEFDGGCQIEIDVDVIPVDTFWELDRYVKEKVNERGRGPWSDDLTTIADTAAAATATDVSNGGSASGGGGKKRKKSISSLEMVGK